MSTAHRRVLGIKDERCHPSPSCPLQHRCARFTSPLPQGIGVKMGNYRSGAIVMTSCSMFLSEMVIDAEPVPSSNPPKPPLKGL